MFLLKLEIMNHRAIFSSVKIRYTETGEAEEVIAPAISLEIYSGPAFSPADGV